MIFSENNLSVLFLFWFTITSSLLFWGCGGDGDGSSVNANISINSISPSPTYAGLETEVTIQLQGVGEQLPQNLRWEIRFGDGQTTSGQNRPDAVTHTYETSGQYPLEARILKNDNVVDRQTRTLEVLSPVDIAVSNSSGAPANVSAGEELTASWQLENQKASPIETPIETEVYLSSSTDVSVEGLSELIELGTTQITPKSEDQPVVPGGGTRQAGMTRQIPEDIDGGDYQVVTYVNPDGTISDPNPDNNLDVSNRIVRIENQSRNAPDVAISDVTVVQSRVFPTLNQFERGYTITNEGQQDAIGLQVETWVSVGDKELNEDDDKLVDTTDAFDVAVGEEQTTDPSSVVLNNEIAPESGETMEVYVIVRAKLQRDSIDPNQKNNTAVSDKITVTDERVDGPDIAVKSLDVTPTSTFLDGTIEIQMSVANEGNQNAGTFFCGIYMGQSQSVNTQRDARLSSINIPGLPSGETKDIEENITIPALYDAGEYYFYTVCDPQGALSEPYRSNNQKIHPEIIDVTNQADVDLKIQGISIPANIEDSEETTVEATVCVGGSNPSGETEGELYLSPGGDLSFEEEPKTTFEIPNINPGSCETIPIEFTPKCIDFQNTFSVGVAVDTSNLVPESNEDNNQKIASNPMRVTGKFCQCNADSFEPNNTRNAAAELQEGEYEGSICEAGGTDYYRIDLSANESLIVRTQFQSDRGALETELFDPSGVSRIDRDTSPDEQSVARFISPGSGAYILAVSASNQSVRSLYEFDINVISPSDGIDIRPYGLSISPAGPYSIGQQIDLSFKSLNLGDEALQDFPARIVISPDQTIGDSNDIVLDGGDIQLNGLSGNQARDENISASLPTSVTQGQYYVGLEFDPGQSLDETETANNTTVVGPFEVRTRCYDPFENNDTFSTSSAIDPGEYFNLVTCSDDEDYYRICADDATKINIELNFDPSSGDIDAQLLDQSQNPVDTSATVSGTENLSVDYVNGAQCYTLHTYIPGGPDAEIETQYDLNVEVSQVDPSLQCRGQFENNDNLSSASSLLAALQQPDQLDRCPQSDEDYYYLDLSQGQNISVSGTKDPASQPGTLRLQLYQPSGIPDRLRETAPGIPTAEIDDYTAPVSGTYYLEVSFGGSNREATYTLSADGLGGIDLSMSNLQIGPGTYESGDTLRYGATLQNIRADEATSVEYSLYLGDSQTLDESDDTKLETRTIGS